MRFTWLLLAIVSCKGTPPFTAGGPIPSAPSDASVADARNVVTFAVDRIFLGDTTPDGVASPEGWESFGYDLDHVTSPSTSHECWLSGGDGVGGIDNSFGAFVAQGDLVALFTDFAEPKQNLSMLETHQIAQGRWTLLFEVAGLPANNNADTVGIDLQVFVGAPLSDPASMDWPVLASSVADGATLASGARTHFTDGFVTAGRFVATSPDAVLTLPLMESNGVVVPLKIHHAAVAFSPVVDNPYTRSQHLEHGLVVGVLDPSELNVALTRGSPLTTKDGSCFPIPTGPTHDIMSDETQQPFTYCNAISIGVGFTARSINNPTTIDSVTHSAAGCSFDAGAD